MAACDVHKGTTINDMGAEEIFEMNLFFPRKPFRINLISSARPLKISFFLSKASQFFFLQKGLQIVFPQSRVLKISWRVPLKFFFPGECLSIFFPGECLSIFFLWGEPGVKPAIQKYRCKCLEQSRLPPPSWIFFTWFALISGMTQNRGKTAEFRVSAEKFNPCNTREFCCLPKDLCRLSTWLFNIIKFGDKISSTNMFKIESYSYI